MLQRSDCNTGTGYLPDTWENVDPIKDLEIKNSTLKEVHLEFSIDFAKESSNVRGWFGKKKKKYSY